MGEACPASGAGNFSSSGSRPTHTRESLRAQAPPQDCSRNCPLALTSPPRFFRIHQQYGECGHWSGHAAGLSAIARRGLRSRRCRLRWTGPASGVPCRPGRAGGAWTPRAPGARLPAAGARCGLRTSSIFHLQQPWAAVQPRIDLAPRAALRGSVRAGRGRRPPDSAGNSRRTVVTRPGRCDRASFEYLRLSPRDFTRASARPIRWDSACARCVTLVELAPPALLIPPARARGAWVSGR